MSEKPCPNCGYCPHCKRRNLAPVYPQPWIYPNTAPNTAPYPYWQVTSPNISQSPGTITVTWTSSGTTI